MEGIAGSAMLKPQASKARVVGAEAEVKDLSDEELVRRCHQVVEEAQRRQLVTGDDTPVWVPENTRGFWKRTSEREEKERYEISGRAVRDERRNDFRNLKRKLEKLDEATLETRISEYQANWAAMKNGDAEEDDKIWSYSVARLASAVRDNKPRQIQRDAEKRWMKTRTQQRKESNP